MEDEKSMGLILWLKVGAIVEIEIAGEKMQIEILDFKGRGRSRLSFRGDREKVKITRPGTRWEGEE